MLGWRGPRVSFYAPSVPEDELDGIDMGDLPEVLERIAAEQFVSDERLDEQSMPVRPVHDGYCPHLRARINEGMRRLQCRECEADLDPFDFLLRLSRDSERFVQARKDAERRAAAARDRLEETLRLERNAKARLSRIEKKLKRPT